MPEIIGLILAKGQSRRLPRKNLRALGGRPLVLRAIDCAKRAQRLNAIFVSTEDQEIAALATNEGVGVINRPPELAQDRTSSWDVWRHALRTLGQQGCDVLALVDIGVPSPMRQPEDIDIAIALYRGREPDAVASVCVTEQDPEFNICAQRYDGFLGACAPGLIMQGTRPDRRVLRLNGAVNVLNPSYVMRANSWWEGRVLPYHMPVSRSLDIDTLDDLMYAEFRLLRQTERGSECGTKTQGNGS